MEGTSTWLDSSSIEYAKISTSVDCRMAGAVECAVQVTVGGVAGGA